MPFILKRVKTIKDISPQLLKKLLLEISKSAVISNCPDGCLKVQNIYYNPDTKELVIKTEDE